MSTTTPKLGLIKWDNNDLFSLANLNLNWDKVDAHVLDKTHLYVCTSTTRPASPQTGQHIFETDTLKKLYWNGSSWVDISIGIIEIPWSLNANASLQTAYLAVIPTARSLISVTAYALTAPVGANLNINILKNGTATGSTITILAGANSASITPNISFAQYDRIGLQITQVGSTTAGGNPLYVTFRFS